MLNGQTHSCSACLHRKTSEMQHSGKQKCRLCDWPHSVQSFGDKYINNEKKYKIVKMASVLFDSFG